MHWNPATDVTPSLPRFVECAGYRLIRAETQRDNDQQGSDDDQRKPAPPHSNAIFGRGVFRQADEQESDAARQQNRQEIRGNNSNAPAAADHSPCFKAMPTTHNGGTSEMAMATPPIESASSSREMIYAPAAPEPNAVKSAYSPGLMREASSPFSVNEIVMSGTIRVKA